jgi:glucose/arabinose dehydrogenase
LLNCRLNSDGLGLAWIKFWANPRTGKFMKKIVGLFFLSLFLTLPASAFEVSLSVPADYKTTKVGSFGNVSAFTFDFEGNYIVAENVGNVFRVNKVAPDGTTTALLDRTSENITNLSFSQGVVYVVSRGRIHKISKGKISNVISGLPTLGDYSNSNLVFNNGVMYFAVGTATNSGVVGPDNTWLKNYPSVRDLPCGKMKVSGVNVETENFLTERRQDKALTGSFSTFNTPVSEGRIVSGMNKCNGAIISANADGSGLKVYAWGLHNPKGLSIDDEGNLWVFDGGMEDRGVRPIKNGKDALYQVSENTWYGWPDFSAGTVVDQPPILAELPNTVSKTVAVFDLAIANYMVVTPEAFYSNSALAKIGDDKISRLDLSTNQISDFLVAANGKILQYKFGPDDKLYVLVSIASGKTELYSIESTTPIVSAAQISSKVRASLNNWMISIMLTIVMGMGVYTIRNLRQTLPPL